MYTIIQIPVTTYYPRTLQGLNETMSAAIASMIGVEPRCEYDVDKLIVTFTEDQWKRFREWYPKKWRTNLTYEIKRHCKMDGIKPDLRNLKIIQ